MSARAGFRLVGLVLCVVVAGLLGPGDVPSAWAQPAPGPARVQRPGPGPTAPRPGHAGLPPGLERMPRPTAPGAPIPGHGRGGPGAPAAHPNAAAAPAVAHGGEHGSCEGAGPNDRPPSINLMHGWLGVNNTKAVPAPPNARVGSSAWWLWRLTPYPWRYDNEADKCDPRNQPVPLLAAVFNFAVLVLLLWRLGRKPLQEALRKRAAAITSEIDAAKAIKQQARKRLKSYQADIDRLDETSEALRLKYAAEAEAEKESLIAEAEQARARMLADAAFRVDQEGKAAREMVSRQAMEQALTTAESLLRSRLTTADRDRLAEEYLSFVGPALRGGATAPTYSGGARA